MTELLTSAQMRAIEQAAIESGAVTGLELMERAGRGVVEAIFDEWPELKATSHRAAILCGPGNNGGDGFVVARLLKEWGWEVEVFLYGDPGKLPPDAKTNYERWREHGEVRPYVEDGEGAFWLDPKAWGADDLIIDALFGTGLTRAVETFNAFAWATQMSGWRIDGAPVGGSDYPDARVVAIDAPSGLCCDSGRILRSASPNPRHEDIRAHLTVSFHALKAGHVLAEGPAACGKTVVKDIGLAHEDNVRIARMASDALQTSTLAKNGTHKYAHGHTFILAGPAGHGGAARLAARGALRIGAGLVTVGASLDAMVENAARLDAIMLRPLQDGDALTLILEDDRINALALGPGLGAGLHEVALVAAALAGKRATVLDADALTLLGREPELMAALHPACVLTPHEGEFRRLFPDLADRLAAPAETGPAYSRIDATREAAARAGCTVLLKGPDTVIADAKGRVAINASVYDRATPWLATAGSGDVLAGFIAGLLARGFSPFEAACTGAWLHTECALSFGPGLIAEDLPEELPKVLEASGV